MTCVNRVVRGDINEKINLHKTFSRLGEFSKVKLYERHPAMLLIRKNNQTLLLFASGKFRIMGKNIVDSCSNIVKEVFPENEINYSLQTETFVHNLDTQINYYNVCNKLSGDRLIRYEPEIFCAIELLHWAPTHVNIFHSG